MTDGQRGTANGQRERAPGKAVRLGAWLSQAWDLVGADLPTFSLAAFIVTSLTLLSLCTLALPLLAGMCIMFLEKRQGNRPTLGHLWEGFYRFPAAIVIWIIYLGAGLPFLLLNSYLYAHGHSWGALGVAVEFLGHCLIATPLFFCIPLIADRDVSAREAVRLSWAKVRPHLGGILAAVFVYTLVLVFGLIACGVGVILTLPLVVAAQMLAYCDLYGEFEVPRMSPFKETAKEESENEHDDEARPSDPAGRPGPGEHDSPLGC